MGHLLREYKNYIYVTYHNLTENSSFFRKILHILQSSLAIWAIKLYIINYEKL